FSPRSTARCVVRRAIGSATDGCDDDTDRRAASSRQSVDTRVLDCTVQQPKRILHSDAPGKCWSERNVSALAVEQLRAKPRIDPSPRTSRILPRVDGYLGLASFPPCAYHCSRSRRYSALLRGRSADLQSESSYGECWHERCLPQRPGVVELRKWPVRRIRSLSRGAIAIENDRP